LKSQEFGSFTMADRNNVAVVDPRVGGVIPQQGNVNMAWTGGSPTQANRLPGPRSFNCYRPQTYKEARMTQQACTEGLKEEELLEVEPGTTSKIKGAVTLMTWMRNLKREVDNLGMDSVFFLNDPQGQEVNILAQYGSVTLEQVQANVDSIRSGAIIDPVVPIPCLYDQQNLNWSYYYIRNSLGPNLRAVMDGKDHDSHGQVFSWQSLERCKALLQT